MMPQPLITITVYGTPAVAGNKSAFPIWRTNPDGSKNFVRTAQVEKDLHGLKKNWRAQVMAAAADIITRDGHILAPYPLDEALAAALVFTVAKPASAPKTRRTWPISRPDIDKLTRAFADALTAAGVLKDDSRIVEYMRLVKVFVGEDPDALQVPGAVVRIWRMSDLHTTRPVTRVQVDEVMSLFT